MIAQGRVSGGTIRNAALGMGRRRRTVRRNSMNKVNNSFRTELNGIMTHDKELIYFVRMKECSFINLSRGRFLIHFPTQGDTPSSFALGYNILALQAGKTFANTGE